MSFTVGGFTFTETEIPGLVVIEPICRADRRGYFMETYRQEAFDAAGLSCRFVQSNQSGSRRGVLRGLHFQKTHPQAKLVRVLRGEVFDVAVDLRKGSAAYGRWAGVRLSGENRRQLMIPRGFAHGFLVLSEYAEFSYQCDAPYRPGDEGGLLWNDPDIGVSWPEAGELLLSERDSRHPTLREAGICF